MANAQNAIPLARDVRLVSQKGAIIALDKPAGMRSHPNKVGQVDQQALLLAPYDLKEEFYTLPDGRRLHLLNRLDSPTSGLVLLATEPDAAALVRARFAAQDVQKTYYALVVGRAGRLRTIWRDRLQTVRRGGGLRTMAGRGALAVTEVRAIAEGQGSAVSLLELTPHTGKTHQLRVQCAERRLPILGDATYGDFSANRRLAANIGGKRLFLHSSRVRVKLTGDSWFQAESAIPDEFMRALGKV